VITVDTMISHLAGALGKPTWLLLKHEPDWRWAPETGGSEWYPSMRLYAQPSPGDWTEVIGRVSRDLDRVFPARAEAEA
jgi:ADP-heptose:LPS heptosyltransferase